MPKLFFDLYHGLPDTSLSSLALSCLVQIASVRRSLFNNTERAKFLNGLVAGVKDILLNPRKLTDPSNYHEFCRLLARLKSNYQLGELVKVRNCSSLIADPMVVNDLLLLNTNKCDIVLLIRVVCMISHNCLSLKTRCNFRQRPRCCIFRCTRTAK